MLECENPQQRGLLFAMAFLTANRAPPESIALLRDVYDAMKTAPAVGRPPRLDSEVQDQIEVTAALVWLLKKRLHLPKLTSAVDEAAKRLRCSTSTIWPLWAAAKNVFPKNEQMSLFSSMVQEYYPALWSKAFDTGLQTALLRRFCFGLRPHLAGPYNSHRTIKQG
jgi:hypothetical protein